VYSTRARHVSVEIHRADGEPPRRIELVQTGNAVFEGRASGVEPGSLYRFRLDGQIRPDPYARWLPRGVHGPAAVTDPRYPWKHPPRSRPLDETVFYELHVGAFTPEGTYQAAGTRLAELADLGVTTIELMPISTFAGTRGWGYDGVAPFAPYPPYGTPDDLRAFVDRAHGVGLSVVLDVVYNHFGPEGNYLASYSPEYFAEGVSTPWGPAPNFANPFMRGLVLSSARSWLVDYRFDGLRVDATHTLFDDEPKHILRELVEEVATLSPKRLLVAEDERNLPSLIDSFGFDAVWADDFHHQLHVLLTGERDGHYACFRPSLEDLARVIERGWLYEGQNWALTGRPRGKPATGLPPSSLVFALQNHDQVGNRALGDRIFGRADAGRLAAATMLLLFLPATPLLFMGQEWGASTPFPYFTDYEPALGASVTRGRRDEFRHFSAFADPVVAVRIPDPQAADTFARAKLDWTERTSRESQELLEVVRTMLRLRRSDAVLRSSTREGLEARATGGVLVATRRRREQGERRVLVVSFESSGARIPPSVVPDGSQLLLASEAGAWNNRQLAPHAAALFRVA
jgi:maltooligosyltrehalose trehalohydrolase